MHPPVGSSSGGSPTVWSISHHRGYCSRKSTVRSPHPCGQSCGAPAAWQTTPSWALCVQACHRLLPWLRLTFAMFPDAAPPGSDQWPWSIAPAIGSAGRLGHPSPSDLGSVVRCALSLCRPRCVSCVVSLATWCLFTGARILCVHRCARCLRYVCDVGGLVGSPPLLFVFLPVFFFFLFFFVLLFGGLFLLCLLSIFMFLMPAGGCLSRFAVCRFLKDENEMEKGRVYTAGTGMGNLCSGAAVLRSSPRCVLPVLCRRLRPRGAAPAS